MSVYSKISTCLWFDNNGLEAAELYVSLIPGSEILNTFHPEPDKPPLIVDFQLAGTTYKALNGGPMFKHSEAASIVVSTKDQEETDRLWDALTADGGSESHCGWLKDRFGVSWQVVPEKLFTLFNSEDRAAAGRAMQELMGMNKIVIAQLEAAYAGNEE